MKIPAVLHALERHLAGERGRRHAWKAAQPREQVITIADRHEPVGLHVGQRPERPARRAQAGRGAIAVPAPVDGCPSVTRPCS